MGTNKNPKNLFQFAKHYATQFAEVMGHPIEVNNRTFRDNLDLLRRLSGYRLQKNDTVVTAFIMMRFGFPDKKASLFLSRIYKRIMNEPIALFKVGNLFTAEEVQILIENRFDVNECFHRLKSRMKEEDRRVSLEKNRAATLPAEK